MSGNILPLFIIALIGSGCRWVMPAADGVEQNKAQNTASTILALEAAESTPRAALAEATLGQRLVISINRKLVRRGNLELEVEDVERLVGTIDSLALSWGGFVADAQVHQNADGHHRASVTLRVPEAEFSAALSALKGLGTVRGHAVTSEDVTKAYFDLETRLAVMREMEARLRELLASNTGKLSEVLQVERELSRVIGQIESMEGEKRYYDRQVSLSTITLTLYEPQALVRASALDPLRRAFMNAVGMFVTSLATLIQLIVVALPWLLVVFLGWAGMKRLRTARAG
ncbi:MAG: DUF4349 domain-containing protein [Gemmatimonadetes bacterium]|nr:MAG: DUF4349 domain-containing protein [Gemmatimonadota bacterium]